MKMLKTLLVSVLFVAQVSAVPTSDDAKKARLAKSIRNLQFNLGLLKKKSQPQKTMISKIGNTIKNNKGKIALGVGLIALGVLAYKNPAVVVNSFNSVVGTAKNFLFGKTAQVEQPMTSVNEVFGKMHTDNLFAPTVANNFVAQPINQVTKIATYGLDITQEAAKRRNAEFILSGLKSCSGKNTPPTLAQIDNFIYGNKIKNTVPESISRYLRDCNTPRHKTSFMGFIKYTFTGKF